MGMRLHAFALAAIVAAALMMPATAQADQTGRGTTDVCIIQEEGKPAAPASAAAASSTSRAAEATPKTGDASAMPTYAVVAAAIAAAAVAACSKGAERRERS